MEEALKAVQREMSLVKQDLVTEQDRSRKLRRELETKSQSVTELDERVVLLKQ